MCSVKALSLVYMDVLSECLVIYHSMLIWYLLICVQVPQASFISKCPSHGLGQRKEMCGWMDADGWATKGCILLYPPRFRHFFHGSGMGKSINISILRKMQNIV